MQKLTCYSCDSIFYFKYDPEDTMDRPYYCPFCGERVEETFDPIIVNQDEDWED